MKNKIKQVLSNLLDDDEEVIESSDHITGRPPKGSFAPVLGDHLNIDLFRSTGENGEHLVYIQIAGFPTDEDAEYYAQRMGGLLHVLFFESDVIH